MPSRKPAKLFLIIVFPICLAKIISRDACLRLRMTLWIEKGAQETNGTFKPRFGYDYAFLKKLGKIVLRQKLFLKFILDKSKVILKILFCLDVS